MGGWQPNVPGWPPPALCGRESQESQVPWGQALLLCAWVSCPYSTASSTAEGGRRACGLDPDGGNRDTDPGAGPHLPGHFVRAAATSLGLSAFGDSSTDRVSRLLSGHGAPALSCRSSWLPGESAIMHGPWPHPAPRPSVPAGRGKRTSPHSKGVGGVDEQPAGPCARAQDPGPALGAAAAGLLLRLPRPEPLSTRGLAQHAEVGARLSLPGLCDTPSPLGHTNSSRSDHHELTSAPEQAPRLHGVHVLGERALS